MSIKIKLLKRQENLVCNFKMILACDVCGKRITKDAPGNIEFMPKNGAEPIFLHKKCSNVFREKNRRMGIDTRCMYWKSIEDVGKIRLY